MDSSFVKVSPGMRLGILTGTGVEASVSSGACNSAIQARRCCARAISAGRGSEGSGIRGVGHRRGRGSEGSRGRSQPSSPGDAAQTACSRRMARIVGQTTAASKSALAKAVPPVLSMASLFHLRTAGPILPGIPQQRKAEDKTAWQAHAGLRV